jgi:hypothetical protein
VLYDSERADARVLGGGFISATEPVASSKERALQDPALAAAER